MTKRELAESYLYELYNVANHVDQNAQIARSNVGSDPAYALESLRRARISASRLEMHYDDAVRSLESLVAEGDAQ